MNNFSDPLPARRSGRGIRTRRRPYPTRTILTAAALGAATGVVLAPVLFALTTIAAPVPALAGFSFGLWSLGALLPLVVLQRSGTGLIGAVAAGVVTAFSPVGAATIVLMGLFGALVEIPFLVTRHRWFGPRMLLGVGLLLGGLSCILSVFTYDLPSVQPALTWLVCIGQLGSAVAGSMVAWVIARSLRRAGIGGNTVSRG